jgi:predicted ABC-class ATPase
MVDWSVAHLPQAGCEALMVDEDTCATNFMIRDARMQELVAADKEPITPFISKVSALDWRVCGRSCTCSAAHAGSAHC